MIKTKEEVEDFLCENLLRILSYGGTEDVLCPKCGQIIEKGEKKFADYYGIAQTLASAMGFSTLIGELIVNVIQEYEPQATYNSETDAKHLTNYIWGAIYQA